MGGFKDDKKELIKENLKIKNQLQVVNSEYENIKRIYNNLLEEYLDLQFAENFDKVLIIQDEVSDLRNANFKLNEELRVLRDETSILKLKEKESSYSQIIVLNEENERLRDELNEKESNLNNLNLEIENLKAQQFSIEKLIEEGNKTKEELFLENIDLKEEINRLKEEVLDFGKRSEENLKNLGKINELNEYIDEFQLEYDKLETEKKEVLSREDSLNFLIKEANEKIQIQENKYRELEEEFEKTLENFENSNKSNSELEMKVRELQDSIENEKKYLNELREENEKNKELVLSFDEKELVLNNKISDLEKKNEEQNDYVNAVELELQKQMNSLKELTDSEDRLHTRVFELEQDEIEKATELETLREKLKNAEELLLLNEEHNFTAMSSFTKFEEKIKVLEQILEEKNQINQSLIAEKDEFFRVKESLENEISYKNSELEQTRFLNEDSLNKLATFEKEFFKLKELIEFSELNSKEVENSYRTLEEKHIKTLHKNYDFRLMTSKMFGKFIEEQNFMKKTIKKLGNELQELKNIEKTPICDEILIHKEGVTEIYETEILTNEEGVLAVEKFEEKTIDESYEMDTLNTEKSTEEEALELWDTQILVEEENNIEKLNSEETEIKLSENVYNVLEEFLIETEVEIEKDNFHGFKPHIGAKEHRVNIRDIFGREPKEEETSDILGSMINDLEKRKEFHIYKSADVEKEEKVELEDFDEINHVRFDEIPLEESIVSKEEGLLHNLKEIYSFEEKTEVIEEKNVDFDSYTEDNVEIVEEQLENEKEQELLMEFGENLQQDLETEEDKPSDELVKKEFENLFRETKEEDMDKEINIDETSKLVSEKLFVENKDLFTKDKLEEFVDFLKFMLPRTIEDDIPLLEKDMLYFMVSFAFYNYNGEDFWELLLDKLEIIESDRDKYKTYLRKELDAVFKIHNFYQLEDEKGERVAGSIIMHSILPVKQMNEFLNAIKSIYTFDLKGNLDKNIFNKLLLRKLQDDNVPKLIKSVNYLQKSENMEILYDYSYEILQAMDSKSKGLDIQTINNEVVSEKISNLFDKNVNKKSRFSFDSFYGFGKK